MERKDALAHGLDQRRAGVDQRVHAIESLIVATIRGSLRPLTKRELLAQIDLLLEGSWTDVTGREVEMTLDQVSLDGIETDHQGRYYAAQMPRSFEESLRFIAESAAWLAELEETEGSDCETVRNRQVTLLFRRPLLDTAREYIVGSRAGMSVDARNELIETNLRLARSVAGGWARSACASIDDDDMFQEACLGLIRAAEKFDPKLGYKFSTYATWWLRQAVTRALADKARTIRIPVHVVERLGKLRRVRRELGTSLGRDPTSEESAARLALTAEQMLELERVEFLDCVGLDELTEEADLRAATSGTESLEDAAAVRVVDARVVEILMLVDAREREVLTLRLGLDGSEPLTLDAVGARFGVTRERVRQIESAALKRLAGWVSLESEGAVM